MQFDIDLCIPDNRRGSLVRELHRQLREAIVNGRLLPGTQLPPTREFSRQYGVSRSTAIAIYDRLQCEGFLTARRGSGTYVAKAVPIVTAVERNRPSNRGLRLRTRSPVGSVLPPLPKLRYDMRLGIPDMASFPVDLWQRISKRVLRAQSKRLSAYLNPVGQDQFRRAVAAHLSFTRAVACNEDNVVATNGAQQAFDMLARTLVVPGQSIVAVEDPGYPPLRTAFTLAGARVCPVPVDQEGLVVDELPPRAEIVCVTPSHQFPTGASMSLSRRNALLEYASLHDTIIIEDDYDGEFRFGGAPVDALQTLDRNGTVFYVGTFSKCLSPTLRLGYMVAPDWSLEAILAVKKATDWHCALLPQLTVTQLIEDGHLAQHIRRMRKIYAARRRLLIDRLESACADACQLIPSHAGLHVAVRLHHAASERTLVSVAASVGIGIEDLGRYAAGKPRLKGLAFGYGNCTEPDIGTAMDGFSALLNRK